MWMCALCKWLFYSIQLRSFCLCFKVLSLQNQLKWCVPICVIDDCLDTSSSIYDSIRANLFCWQHGCFFTFVSTNNQHEMVIYLYAWKKKQILWNWVGQVRQLIGQDLTGLKQDKLCQQKKWLSSSDKRNIDNRNRWSHR